MQKKFFELSSIVFAVIFLSLLGVALTHNSSAWTGPTSPPPLSNAPSPLDTSSINQSKLGGLTIGKDLYLESGLRFISNGGSSYGYFVNLADTLTYNTLTNGVEVKRFTIGNDGNVAIGSITPAAKLHVDGDIKANGKIYANGLEVLTSGNVTVPPNSIGSNEVIDGSLTSADVNLGSIQARVDSSGCPNGQAIRTIAQDGKVTCELTAASYTAGTGISISGTNVISAAVDWSQLSGIPPDFADGVDNTSAGGGGALSTYTVTAHSGSGGQWLNVACAVGDFIVGVGSQGGTNAQAACTQMTNSGNSCYGYFVDNSYIFCIHF